MPRPRPPHLHREVSRHGVMTWYLRRGHGPRTRIRSEFGTPEFEAEYRAALDRAPAELRKNAVVGSLEWLWKRYRETTAWTALSLATRKQRENIMRGVLKQSGHEQATAIKRQHVVAGRDRRADTPAQARNFLDAVRGLFRWAVDAGHVKTDPASGVKNPARPKTAGFPVWTEDDVERYEKRWPIGTKERVWLAVLLYTGLRRGDAVRLGRQHVRDGVATIRTEKTGVTVTIPILPALDEILRAGPCTDLAFICGENGGPLGRNHSVTCFAKPATRPVSGSPRTACERSVRRERRTTAPPLPSWKPSSAGKAVEWRRSTRARPTGRAWQRGRWRSSIERPVNNLFPHLPERCGRKV
jgi:integrase